MSIDWRMGSVGQGLMLLLCGRVTCASCRCTATSGCDRGERQGGGRDRQRDPNRYAEARL